MKLLDFLNKRQVSYREFAAQVDSTAEAVRLWVTGQRIPKREFMDKIKAVTKGKVTPNDFYPESDVA
jgi:hypothetical protein